MHTLAIHYLGGIGHIENVDEDRYSHLDLINDACQVGKVQCGNAITLKYAIPKTQAVCVLHDDVAVMKMFEMHKGINEIRILLVEEVVSQVSHVTQENDMGARHGEGEGDEDCMEEDVEVSDDDEWDKDSEESHNSFEIDDSDASEEMNQNGEDNELSNCESDPDYISLCNSDDEDDHDYDHEDGFEFDMEHGLNNPKLEKGIVFGNVDDFRVALIEFAIREGFNLKRIKNERTRVTVTCAAAGCKWRLHASPKSDGVTFMIKSIQPEHSCSRVHKNTQATSRWISKKILSQVRSNTKIPICSIREKIQSEYGVDPRNVQLRRARRKAVEEVEGTHGESYGKLWRYGEIIRATNPCSLVKIETDRIGPSYAPKFKRIFVSFSAMRNGLLEGYRPFIGLDGCHLKVPYGGILLSTIALDGNGGLFPVAYVVVEAETQHNWLFFLNHLLMIIGSVNLPWTFMTDRQKGIIKAIGEIFPHACHRYCARHMYSNFKSQYKGVLLKNLFWRASRAYTLYEFNTAMESMKKASIDAYNWVKEIPAKTWSRHAFDVHVKNDHITNNVTESFNQWIGEQRDKPILTLLDTIRMRWMVKIQKRYQVATTWTASVTPRASSTLDTRRKVSRNCTLLFAGADEYEVIDDNGRHIVKIRSMSCTCMVWNISGIPCRHAITCINYRREHVENHCAPCYRVETYLRAYGHMIHPIPDERMWPTVALEPLMPPSLRRLSGRPKKNRRREQDEPERKGEIRRSSTIRCCICKQFGHNKRTCQHGPIRAKSRGSQPTQVGHGHHEDAGNRGH